MITLYYYYDTESLDKPNIAIIRRFGACLSALILKRRKSHSIWSDRYTSAILIRFVTLPKRQVSLPPWVKT
jgi:hypothetical protein